MTTVTTKSIIEGEETLWMKWSTQEEEEGKAEK